MGADTSAIIVLAFVATAAVFGYLAFTIISGFHTPQGHNLLFSGSLIFIRDGHVWKIVFPVTTLGGSVDFRASKSNMSMNFDGRTVVAGGGEGITLFNSSVIMGSLSDRFTSFRMPIIRVQGGVTDTVEVSVFAYRGPDRLFRLVIDDDDDGVLDSSYLVEFVENNNNRLVNPINTSGDIVLSTDKGDSFSMSYLIAIYASSMSYDPQIVVKGGDTLYRISLVNVLKGLTKASVITAIIGGNGDYRLNSGETGYIILILPENVASIWTSSSVDVSISIGGEKQKLKLIIPSKPPDNGMVSGVVQVVS